MTGGLFCASAGEAIPALTEWISSWGDTIAKESNKGAQKVSRRANCCRERWILPGETSASRNRGFCLALKDGWLFRLGQRSAFGKVPGLSGLGVILSFQYMATVGPGEGSVKMGLKVPH